MPAVFLLLAAAALAWSAPTVGAAPVEARARSLRVKHTLCPYFVHRLDRTTVGLKGVRWLEIKCERPNEVVTVGAERVKCRQVSYKARLGGGAPFKVGAGCIATLLPAGLPALPVEPEVVL